MKSAQILCRVRIAHVSEGKPSPFPCSLRGKAQASSQGLLKKETRSGPAMPLLPERGRGNCACEAPPTFPGRSNKTGRPRISLLPPARKRPAFSGFCLLDQDRTSRVSSLHGHHAQCKVGQTTPPSRLLCVPLERRGTVFLRTV